MNTAPTPGPDAPRPPRTALWVKIVLGVSLALNLAIIGLVVGAFARVGPELKAMPGVNYAMPYAMALPREERVALLRDVRRTTNLPSRQERRAHYAKMLQVLRADQFDPDEARALMSTQARVMVAAQQAAQDAWIKKTAAFTPQERLSYADALEEALRRRRPPGKPRQ